MTMENHWFKSPPNKVKTNNVLIYQIATFKKLAIINSSSVASMSNIFSKTIPSHIEIILVLKVIYPMNILLLLLFPIEVIK